MRAAVLGITLLLGLCSIACSRSYSPKQIQLVANEISRSVPGAQVNREFFADSRARPYLGRFFGEDEFRADRSAVAVISYKAWQNMFHSLPEVIGSRIQLDGRTTTIIGVAERDFAPSRAGEFWIPKS